jgi:hypothetical protein
VSDDDLGSERCPICKAQECKKHLLARFASSGDNGAFGIGLIDGPLRDATEIEEALRQPRLFRVQSLRATGDAKLRHEIIKIKLSRITSTSSAALSKATIKLDLVLSLS